MGNPDPRGSDYRTCDHEWQPVTFVCENQLLTDRGQVIVRQPDPTQAKCCVVCLKCATHSYMTTRFVYRLYGIEDMNDKGVWLDDEGEVFVKPVEEESKISIGEWFESILTEDQKTKILEAINE